MQLTATPSASAIGDSLYVFGMVSITACHWLSGVSCFLA